MDISRDIIASLLEPGTVAVMATDTVYGLVARAVDQAAVTRLYELKDRHAKPGTLLASSIDQLVELGLTRRYLKAVEQFWPGAVSVIVPTTDPKLVYLTQGLPDLAVRIPDNPRVLEILNGTGPLMTSSANNPGQPPAETIDQAKAYFGDKISHYFDGGNRSGSLPSTVIRVIDDAIEVIRQGSVIIPGA